MNSDGRATEPRSGFIRLSVRPLEELMLPRGVVCGGEIVPSICLLDSVLYLGFGGSRTRTDEGSRMDIEFDFGREGRLSVNDPNDEGSSDFCAVDGCGIEQLRRGCMESNPL